MSEREMQEMWARKLFSVEAMTTTDGRSLQVLDWGVLNYDQGPDFSNARVSLDGIAFYGDIELHLHSRDWFRHGHDSDPGYNSVVLHVVLDDDPVAALRQDGTTVPTLCIGARINLAGKRKAGRTVDARWTMPCTPLTRDRRDGARKVWLREAARRRATQKLAQVHDLVRLQTGDWEAALWRSLATYIAGPVNREAFTVIAERASFAILRKCIHRPLQVEAMLFGVAGMLEGDTRSPYPDELKEEWKYLAAKYSLRAPPMPLKLHRMRPASFPVYRLSQLAEIVCRFQGLAPLLAADGLAQFRQGHFEATTYWRRNSDFGEKCRIAPRSLGNDLKQTVLVNALLPFHAAYTGRQNADASVQNLAQSWAGFPPEDNRITRSFQLQGWEAKDAAETQGMLYLHKTLCTHKGCLQCPVGQDVMACSPVVAL
jgi:hypothetical protein